MNVEKYYYRYSRFVKLDRHKISSVCHEFFTTHSFDSLWIVNQRPILYLHLILRWSFLTFTFHGHYERKYGHTVLCANVVFNQLTAFQTDCPATALSSVLEPAILLACWTISSPSPLIILRYCQLIVLLYVRLIGAIHYREPRKCSFNFVYTLQKFQGILIFLEW